MRVRIRSAINGREARSLIHWKEWRHSVDCNERGMIEGCRCIPAPCHSCLRRDPITRHHDPLTITCSSQGSGALGNMEHLLICVCVVDCRYQWRMSRVSWRTAQMHRHIRCSGQLLSAMSSATHMLEFEPHFIAHQLLQQLHSGNRM